MSHRLVSRVSLLPVFFPSHASEVSLLRPHEDGSDTDVPKFSMVATGICFYTILDEDIGRRRQKDLKSESKLNSNLF